MTLAASLNWLRTLRSLPVAAVVLSYLIVVSQTACLAADWNQWGGSQERNMASQERGLPTRFEPGKRRRDRIGIDTASTQNVRWVARLGSKNYSSATVADGRVYIGTNDDSLDDPRYVSTRGGLLMCLNEKSGDTIWQLVVPRLEIDRSKVSEDFDDMNLGVCSTATIDEDCVYIVTNRCEVLCLDANGLANGNDGPFTDEAAFSVADGTPPVALRTTDADILWRFDMLRDLPVFPHDAANCSVLIHGDYAYVGTANGVYDGKVVLPTAPSLIALNKHTGRLAARDDGHISADVFHGQWSSPTLVRLGDTSRIVYGAGDGACYAFEPVVTAMASPSDSERNVATLNELWHFDCNPPGYRERGGAPIDYWALVRGGPKDVDADGWLVSPSEVIASPVIADGRVYVSIGQDPLHGSGRGALSCIDPAGQGDISNVGCVWRYQAIGRSLSTVAVADGYVYAAELFGKIHCLDADNGRLNWVHDTNEEIWSSTFVADGKVYVGTRRGLTILAAGPQKRHLADIRLGSESCSAPTAANGVLYVASQKHLWAVEEQGELP